MVGSEDVSSEWQTLARQLDLDEMEIINIEYQESCEKDMCYQALLRWKERAEDAENPATVQQLIDVLKKLKYRSVASK